MFWRLGVALLQAAQGVIAALPEMPDINWNPIAPKVPGRLPVAVKLKDHIGFSAFADQIRSQLFKQPMAMNAVVDELINRAGITFAMNQLGKYAVLANPITKGIERFQAVLDDSNARSVVGAIAAGPANPSKSDAAFTIQKPSGPGVVNLPLDFQTFSI